MSFLGTLIGGAGGFLLGGPAGAAIGASLGGGVDASQAASKAAGMQAESADRALQLQERMFNKQVELQEPWRQAGVNALAKLQSGNIGMYEDPSYKFRLGEGLKALDRQAAARGGLISGGALKAAQRYGQDVASQEYGNIWNRLASQAGIGQTATNQLAGQAGQYGTAAGGLMTDAARARASGYVGSANALNQAIGGAGNAYMQNQILNRLFAQQPAGGYNWQQPQSTGMYSDATQIPMQPGGGY